MQKEIKIAQAFGMIGEMFDLTPRRVDAVELATDIDIGDVVCSKSDGTLGKYTADSYTNFVGICVRAKEQINYGGTEPLSPSLKVPAGVTTQVASMGRIIVALKLSVTGKSDADTAVTALKALTDIAPQAKLYFTSGILSTTGTGTPIGKIIRGADVSEEVYGITTSGSGSSFGATGFVNVVIEIGC